VEIVWPPMAPRFFAGLQLQPAACRIRKSHRAPLQVPFLSPRLGPDAALAPGTGDLSRLAIANQRSAADETKLNNANHYNKTSVRWEKNSERCLEIRAQFLF